MKNIFLVTLGLVLMGAGCFGLPVDRMSCIYDGAEYAVGDGYFDGCNMQTCQEDGSFIGYDRGCEFLIPEDDLDTGTSDGSEDEGEDSIYDDPHSYGDDGIGDEVTISGMTMVGKFGGTEMGCEFSDAVQTGSRMECNKGSVQIGLIADYDGKEIWLDEYYCDATEVLVYGSETEYETSNCTDGIQIEEMHTFYGSLGWSVEPWHIGSENGEWLMTDAVLMH